MGQGGGLAEGRGMACGRGYEGVGGGNGRLRGGGLEVLSEVAVAAPGEGCWLGAWEGKGRAVVKEAARVDCSGYMPCATINKDQQDYSCSAARRMLTKCLFTPVQLHIQTSQVLY